MPAVSLREMDTIAPAASNCRPADNPAVTISMAARQTSCPTHLRPGIFSPVRKTSFHHSHPTSKTGSTKRSHGAFAACHNHLGGQTHPCHPRLSSIEMFSVSDGSKSVNGEKYLFLKKNLLFPHPGDLVQARRASLQSRSSARQKPPSGANNPSEDLCD